MKLLTLVSEKDGDTALLKNYGIPYVLCSKSTGKNVIEKGFLFLGLTFRFLWEAEIQGRYFHRPGLAHDGHRRVADRQTPPDL